MINVCGVHKMTPQ